MDTRHLTSPIKWEGIFLRKTTLYLNILKRHYYKVIIIIYISISSYPMHLLFFFFFYTRMSLNCLTRQVLKRTNSHEELREKIKNVQGKSNFRLFSGVERNWSGNLVKNPRSLVGQENKAKKGCRRIHNSGPIEYLPDSPRLARSPGIRRDWSFEDLRQVINR